MTGDSRNTLTVARLDALMRDLSIHRFDASFIDGAHEYKSVKMDFATCLLRTSKTVGIHDSVMIEIREFIDELMRAGRGWKYVNVVNPNRRLPCLPHAHTCDSDYSVETGGGIFMLFLDENAREAFSHAERRMRSDLAPADPLFQPTRSYFHRRGVRGSPVYAAFWAGLYPRWAFTGSRLFADVAPLYRQSLDEQLKGNLERSLKLARQAERASHGW